MGIYTKEIKSVNIVVEWKQFYYKDVLKYKLIYLKVIMKASSDQMEASSFVTNLNKEVTKNED